MSIHRSSIAAPPDGPAAHVDLIKESHERCTALGLTRIERPDYEPLMRSDLNDARERNRKLHTHAAPVMELLLEQIAGTQSMIVLTDAHGTILHSVGDEEFVTRAGKVALSPGVNWAEHSKGTNAIGTALFAERPTLVHAEEHFMHANQFLTCSAAPIFDPRGNMLGVLDVSGDHRAYHQHTMGLVRMSARMIENHWLNDHCANRLRLHFHSRPEFIGTLLEGIVVVGADGKLQGANRSALDQLGLSGVALRNQTLTSLFGTTVAALVDHFRSPLALPMKLMLADGRQFLANARMDWATLAFMPPGPQSAESAPLVLTPQPPQAQPQPPGATQVFAQPGVAAPPQAPSGPLPTGLAYLQTGDVQIEAVVQKARRIINRDIPLLILGETGTGKELLAHAVHQESNRSKQPFVAVNCASIPESLIEAELFGYEEGAFTGARRKGATGRIVQANGGTLFLDEIGDMPLPLQARLLRVLQERCVTPLGSGKSIAVDIAVIGATHRNLREMIQRGEFREDLYYRLNGLVLRLPPLRERSDLSLVAQRILANECPQGAPRISAEVMALFQRCDWPGNIRQLANVLRTAAVMAAGEPQITQAHLSDDFLEDVRRLAQQQQAAALAAAAAAQAQAQAQPAMAQPVAMPAGPAAAPFAAPGSAVPPAAAYAGAGYPGGYPAGTVLGSLPATPMAGTPAAALPGQPPSARTLHEQEITMIQAALDAAGGNISEASKRLGISRNTIYRKLRWNRPESDVS
ncbi:sigma-54-dependent Fis family transcriptional regulator [Azohydromonas lata]|uniref:sigma-54-dependent Fis family transcriptional regulator n=1 Tax=Azohydromonas lata TaxID=45677 RepID=UPI00082C9DD8|nr:sigma-54-dependent Fis family transcriptional regulator [Azohydromonas lata]